MFDQSDARFANQLIHEAGDLLLEYWPGGSGSRSLGEYEKSDGTLLTAADTAVNELVVSRLSAQYPEDGIISEEGEGKNAESERVWIVDPLDGTSRFAAGEDDFNILIALSVSGSIELGMSNFAARGECYSASRIEPTSCGETAVSVSQRREPEAVHWRGGNLSSVPEWCSTRPLDSGEAFRRVYCGELDGLVLRFGRIAIWDVAAPTALVERAGGTVTDENGDPLRFNDTPFAPKYIVASNGKIHSAILELVASSTDR